MNDYRRAKLKRIISELVAVDADLVILAKAEIEAVGNIPESLHTQPRVLEMKAAAENLTDAVDRVRLACWFIGEAHGQ